MITKFARLEFELFTKPSKSDFLRVHRYYVDKKKAPKWLYRDFILGYFGKRRSTSQGKYNEFVHSLVGKDYDSPLEDVICSVILSSPEYAQAIKDKFLKKKPQDRELPALAGFVNRPDIGTIADMVDSVIQTDDRLAKQIKLYFCHRYSGLKLQEIGDYFGIGPSGVSQASHRFDCKLKSNRKLLIKIGKIKKELEY